MSTFSSGLFRPQGVLSSASAGGRSTGGLVNRSTGARGSVQTLAGNREEEIRRILQLFNQFGTSAKQDIREQVSSQQARFEGDLISRGLGNTTLRQPLLADIARRGLREERRVDEDRARLEADFRASQLIRPETIAQAAQGAASAGSAAPVRAVLGAGSSSSRPNLADSLRNKSSSTSRQATPQFGSGGTGSGARIVTRDGAFSPSDFQDFRSGQQTGPTFEGAANPQQGGTQQQGAPQPTEEQAAPEEPKGGSQAFTPRPGQRTVTLEAAGGRGSRIPKGTLQTFALQPGETVASITKLGGRAFGFKRPGS